MLSKAIPIKMTSNSFSLIKVNMLLVFVSLTILLTLQSCTESDKKRVDNNWAITQINSLSNSGKTISEADDPSLSYKHEMYLVEGWKNFTEEEVILKLDSFVQDSFSRDLQNYRSYQILFIGNSYQSNLADLEKFAGTLFSDYSSEKDMLATYQWRKGSFYQKEYAYRGTRYPNIIEKGQ